MNVNRTRGQTWVFSSGPFHSHKTNKKKSKGLCGFSREGMDHRAPGWLDVKQNSWKNRGKLPSLPLAGALFQKGFPSASVGPCFQPSGDTDLAVYFGLILQADPCIGHLPTTWADHILCLLNQECGTFESRCPRTTGLNWNYFRQTDTQSTSSY